MDPAGTHNSYERCAALGHAPGYAIKGAAAAATTVPPITCVGRNGVYERQVQLVQCEDCRSCTEVGGSPVNVILTCIDARTILLSRCLNTVVPPKSVPSVAVNGLAERTTYPNRLDDGVTSSGRDPVLLQATTE